MLNTILKIFPNINPLRGCKKYLTKRIFLLSNTFRPFGGNWNHIRLPIKNAGVV
jgi:hypothetical protein